MFRGLVPPTACPVSLPDIFLSWRIPREGARPTENFCSVVAERVGKRYAFAFNHARTAITVLLQELHRMYPEKDEVVAPAYTCYTVAAAIARAGLVLVPVDVETTSLCYQQDALRASITPRSLAVIVVHPFGLPCDVEKVKEAANGADVFILEDCAQAWDSRYKQRSLGGRGDASVFSFGRGKHLNLGGGGICCLDDTDLALRVKRRLEALPKPSLRSQMRRLIQLALTTTGQHPYTYALALRLPFIEIGETYFQPDFPQMQWSEWQAQLGLRLWSRWEEMREARRRNALCWQQWLPMYPWLGMIPRMDDVEDVSYLRMPVLCEKRSQAMGWFRKRGIHAQRMYPQSLVDVGDPRLRIKVYSSLEGARWLARALYTLPVHPLFDAQAWCKCCGSIEHAFQEDLDIAGTAS